MNPQKATSGGGMNKKKGSLNSKQIRDLEGTTPPLKGILKHTYKHTHIHVISFYPSICYHIYVHTYLSLPL